MNPIPLDELARMVGGEIFGARPGSTIEGFATDSREVRPGDLFIAIRGERVDGHDFAEAVMQAGAVAILAERAVPGPHVLVPNVVGALAGMAASFRNRFPGPVVGVTGSAGKTTAKEFLAAALSPLGSILKTTGNRNTEYTVPLLWPEIEEGTRAVVVEMAMRGFGQIAHLASFCRPTVGVITNVGYSHLSEVGSREGIAIAKAELLAALPSDGVAVLWSNDDYVGFLRSRAPKEIVTFGFEPRAGVRLTGYRPLDWHRSQVTGSAFGSPFEMELPAVGRHIALGAAAALAVAVRLGVPIDRAAASVTMATLPPMRMEIIEWNGATILLDAYNAAPPSVLAAIQTLAEAPHAVRRRAVLGDMRELGASTEEAHRAMGRYVVDYSLDDVCFFGDATRLAEEEAIHLGMSRSRVHRADSLGEVAEFLSRVQPGDAVLIKGSRALELERALDAVGVAR